MSHPLTDAETIQAIRKTLEDRGWLDPSVDLIHGIGIMVDLLENHQRNISIIHENLNQWSCPYCGNKL